MISRFKKSIDQATMMLNVICRTELPPMAIVDFELFIVKKIKEAENLIRRQKNKSQTLRLEKANNRPTKERSTKITEEIKNCEEKVEQYKYLIYIWKCYGDSIAFHHCDKYALKHLMYDENYNEKETAGFISGKKGFQNEVRFLKYIATQNIPAVLSDITNTIRHGDVCLLGMSDPYPIEIKSSPKIDKRGEKQIRNIKEINSFFTKDEADNFRGKGPVLRREADGKETNHCSKINQCIELCYTEGTSYIKPESGITYLAITDFKEEILGKAMGKYMHLINLNVYKTALRWHPYTPFLLTLDPRHVYNFINGSLTIIVLLDLQLIKRRFKRNNLHIRFLQDENWYAQISRDGDIRNGGFRVSVQSFLRLAFEFQSLKWSIKQHKQHFNQFTEELGTSGTFREIPDDWLKSDDGIPA